MQIHQAIFLVAVGASQLLASAKLIKLPLPSYDAFPPLVEQCEIPKEYGNSKCHIDLYNVANVNINSTKYYNRIAFDISGSDTRCRTVAVNANIKVINPSDGVKQVKLECYAQYGCAGVPSRIINDYAELDDKVQIRSCRISAACPTTQKPSDYGAQPPVEDEKYCQKGRNTYGAPEPPKILGPWYAVLYELSGFRRESTSHSAQERWIDGKSGPANAGECRGLGDIPIRSVQMLKSAGAEPTEANLLSLDAADDVTLVYYTDYGCKGKIMGATTGHDANVQLNGNPKSVRFVATGLDNSYYEPKYDGVSDTVVLSANSDGSNTSDATSNAVSLVSVVAAAFFSF